MIWSFSVYAINRDCPINLHKNDHLRQYGNSCYEFILDHPGDWHYAEQDCMSKNGHLVDIHSFTEQAFLFNTLQVYHSMRTLVL